MLQNGQRHMQMGKVGMGRRLRFFVDSSAVAHGARSSEKQA